MEVELMVIKRDDDRPTDRVNIEQSASGRLKGKVLQFLKMLFSKTQQVINKFSSKHVQDHATYLLVNSEKGSRNLSCFLFSHWSNVICSLIDRNKVRL